MRLLVAGLFGFVGAAIAVGCGPARKEKADILCPAGPFVQWDELALAEFEPMPGDAHVAEIQAGMELSLAVEGDDQDLYGHAIGPAYPLQDIWWAPVVDCPPDGAGERTRTCTYAIVRVEGGAVSGVGELVTTDVGHQQPLAMLLDDVRLVPYDVDGDGANELTVELTVQGESMPAVGPQTDTWLSFVDRETAQVMWVARTAANGAGGQEDCASSLTLQDVDCNGRRDVRLQTDCWPSICRQGVAAGEPDPCPADPRIITDERWSQPPGERVYQPVP